MTPATVGLRRPRVRLTLLHQGSGPVTVLRTTGLGPAPVGPAARAPRAVPALVPAPTQETPVAAPKGAPWQPSLPLMNAAEVHLALSRDLIDHALASGSVTVRSDAVLEAMEHVARAFGELFDPETARAMLARMAQRL